MNTSTFLQLIQFIVAQDTDQVARCLRATPELAPMASPVGATRQAASEFFFPTISHYLYAGDTALHMAAACCSRKIAQLLVQHGANTGARNRRHVLPLRAS